MRSGDFPAKTLWAVVGLLGLVCVEVVQGECDTGASVVAVAELATGYVAFSQDVFGPECDTQARFYAKDMNGANSLRFTIHTQPVQPSLPLLDRCASTNLGAVFDPFQDPSRAVGDLATRAGLLFGVAPLSWNANVGVVPLVGQHSIVGRSLVVENAEDNVVLDCATIQYPDGFGAVELSATFDGDVVGTVKFVGIPAMDSRLSYLDVQLSRGDAAPTASSHDWEVLDTASCDAVTPSTPVFAPSIASALCSPAAASCEMGNLTAAMGPLALGPRSTGVPQRLFHPLLVFGWGGSVAHKVLVVRADDGAVLACAPINSDVDCANNNNNSTARVIFSGNIQGSITFHQPRASCPTTIDVNLSVVGATTPATLSVVVEGAADLGLAGDCSPSTPWACGLGDLTGKIDALEDSSVELEWQDWSLPLHGPNAVQFLNVEVSRDGAFLSSAAIEPAMGFDTLSASTNWASFQFLGNAPGFEGMVWVKTTMLVGSSNPLTAEVVDYSYFPAAAGTSCSSLGDVYNPSGASQLGCFSSSLLSYCPAGALSGKFGFVEGGVVVDWAMGDLWALAGRSVRVTDSRTNSASCNTIGGIDYAYCQVDFASINATVVAQSTDNGYWRALDHDLTTHFAAFDNTFSLRASFPPFHLTAIGVLPVDEFEEAWTGASVTVRRADTSQWVSVPLSPATQGGVFAYSLLTASYEVDMVMVESGNVPLVVAEFALFTECYGPYYGDAASYIAPLTPSPPTVQVGGPEVVDVGGGNLVARFAVTFDQLTSFDPAALDVTCSGFSVIGSPLPTTHQYPYSHECASACPNGYNCPSNLVITEDCWNFAWRSLGCTLTPPPFTPQPLTNASRALTTSLTDNPAGCVGPGTTHPCLAARKQAIPPSGSGTATGLSLACVQWLLGSAGCSAEAVTEGFLSLGFGATRTLDDALYEAVLWSALNDDAHVQQCYRASSDFVVQCPYTEGEEVTLSFSSSAIVSTSGASLVGTTTFTLAQDTTPPTLTRASLVTTNPSLTHARLHDSLTATLRFSEPVEGSVWVGGQQAWSVQWGDGGREVNATVVVAYWMEEGAVRVRLDVADLAGNKGPTDATVENEIIIDLQPPRAQIAANATSTTSTSTATVITSSPVSFAIVVSEPVALSPSRLVLAHCDNPSVAGPEPDAAGGELYTLWCDVADDVVVRVEVGEGVVDVAGNGVGPVASVAMRTDLFAPTAALTLLSPSTCGTFLTAHSVTLRITPSENVTLNTTGRVLQASAQSSLSAAQWTETVGGWDEVQGGVVALTLPPSFETGAVVLSVGVGLLEDGVGRVNTEASNTVTLRYGPRPFINKIDIEETEDPLLYDTVYGTNDTIVLEFDEPTNTAGVCAECALPVGALVGDGACDTRLPREWVDAYVVFSESIGTDYTAVWEDCDKLVITVHNTTGAGNIAALTALAKQPTALACDSPGHLRNAYGTSLGAAQTLADPQEFETNFGECEEGEAGSDGKCVCATDYIGADCSVFCKWEHMSVSAVQRARGTCVCAQNYFNGCQTECVDRSAQYFSSHPQFGPHACVCDPGYIGTTCNASCGPGSFAPSPPPSSPSPMSCEACPIGTYSSRVANSGCLSCPEGTFSGEAGASECVACPANTETRVEGATSVMECYPSQGYFRAGSAQQSTFSVVACDQPLKCEYWWGVDKYHGGVLVEAEMTEQELWCDDIGFYGSCVQCRCDESNANITNVDKECYTGYMCGRCREGYYNVGTSCQRCPSSTLWLTVVLCIGFAFVLVFFYKAAPYLDSTGTVSIFFNFFQLLAFYQYFNVRLPKALQALLDILSFFTLGLQLMQPECQQPFLRKYENRFLLTLCVPVVVALFFVGLFLYQAVYKSAKFRFFFHREVRRQRRLTQRSEQGQEMRVPLARTASLRSKMFQSSSNAVGGGGGWGGRGGGGGLGGKGAGKGGGEGERRSRARPSLIRAVTAEDMRDPVAAAALLNVRKRFEGESKHALGRRGTRFRQILNAAALRDGIADLTNVQHTLDMCVNGFLTFLSVVYLMLVLQILSVFDCSYHDDVGQYRLDAEPSIECFVTTGPYRTLIGGATVGLVVYVIGIPAFFAFVLFGKRRHLESWQMRSRYGFLYQRFARAWFWWELVVALRKFLFVFLQLFTDYYVHFSISCSLLVVFGALCAHIYAMPYSSDLLNRLELVLLVGNFVVLLGLLQLVDDEFNNSQGEALGFVVVGIVLFLALICAKVFWIEVRRRANDASVALPPKLASPLNNNHSNNNSNSSANKAGKRKGLVARLYGRLLEKERTKRGKLVSEVQAMALGLLDHKSLAVLDSWVVHNATYTELEMWLRFMQQFEKFEEKARSKPDISEHVPKLRKEKVAKFWLWLSKAHQQDIISLSRSLTHIRLFKRWQLTNEKRVQRFVIDQIKESMFLNANLDHLPAPQRRWAVVRRAVITGRWRRLPWAREGGEGEWLASPRAWLRSAMQSMPQRFAGHASAQFALERKLSMDRKHEKVRALSHSSFAGSEGNHDANNNEVEEEAVEGDGLGSDGLGSEGVINEAGVGEDGAGLDVGAVDKESAPSHRNTLPDALSERAAFSDEGKA